VHRLTLVCDTHWWLQGAPRRVSGPGRNRGGRGSGEPREGGGGGRVSRLATPAPTTPCRRRQLVPTSQREYAEPIRRLLTHSTYKPFALCRHSQPSVTDPPLRFSWRAEESHQCVGDAIGGERAERRFGRTAVHLMNGSGVQPHLSREFVREHKAATALW
jgi:hypothetical protein